MKTYTDRTGDKHETDAQAAHRLVLAIPEGVRSTWGLLAHLPAKERDEIGEHVAQAVCCICEQSRAVQVDASEAFCGAETDIGEEAYQSDVGAAIASAFQCSEERIGFFEAAFCCV